jgi:uncharacterized protein YjbI with pentapeptide repeats
VRELFVLKKITRGSGNGESLDTKIIGLAPLLGGRFCKSLDFSNTTFHNFFVIDQKSSFEGDVVFRGTSFLFNGAATIGNSSFRQNLLFAENTIGAILSISNLELGEHAAIEFSKPNFMAKDIGDAGSQNGLVVFEKIEFRPFKTIFRDVPEVTGSIIPHLSFNYCNLTNSYFERCSFSNISLFTSIFEGARYILCRWPERKRGLSRRRQIIFEDGYVHARQDRRLKGSVKRKLEHIDLSEVSSLYNQFKNAFDKLKRYDLSGEFYYNELNLRMEQYREKNKVRWLLFFLFKRVSWFGQRPGSCVVWLVGAVLAFSVYSLLSGVAVNPEVGGHVIKYKVDLQNISVLLESSFWSDFSTAFRYSLEKVFPFKLVTFTDQKIFSVQTGLGTFCVTAIYTILANLWVYFAVIGMRRHFKRF